MSEREMEIREIISRQANSSYKPFEVQIVCDTYDDIMVPKGLNKLDRSCPGCVRAALKTLRAYYAG